MTNIIIDIIVELLHVFFVHVCFATVRNIFLLLKNPALHGKCVDAIYKYIREKHRSVDAIVTPEAKGFLFGSNIAAKLKVKFIPIRKAGKLLADPGDLIQHTFRNRKNEVKVYR